MRALVLGALLSLLAVAAAVLAQAPSLEAAQTAARWTARVGFPLFALAFARPGLARAGLPCPPERPLFLAFAGSHLVHLAALLTYVLLSEGRPDPVRLLGGALGYAAIILVVARPASWSWAAYYLWFVFFMTYWPRVLGSLPGAGGDPRTFPVFLAFVALILVVRLASLVPGAPLVKEG
jgi:hypothetical protein